MLRTRTMKKENGKIRIKNTKNQMNKERTFFPNDRTWKIIIKKNTEKNKNWLKTLKKRTEIK